MADEEADDEVAVIAEVVGVSDSMLMEGSTA
jgi:hypothetical protein